MEPLAAPSAEAARDAAVCVATLVYTPVSVTGDCRALVSPEETNRWKDGDDFREVRGTSGGMTSSAENGAAVSDARIVDMIVEIGNVVSACGVGGMPLEAFADRADSEEATNVENVCEDDAVDDLDCCRVDVGATRASGEPKSDARTNAQKGVESCTIDGLPLWVANLIDVATALAVCRKAIAPGDALNAAAEDTAVAGRALSET